MTGHYRDTSVDLGLKAEKLGTSTPFAERIVVSPDGIDNAFWSLAPTQIKAPVDGTGPNSRDPQNLYDTSHIPKEDQRWAIKSLEQASASKIQEAWNKSQWKGIQLVMEDVSLWCMSDSSFMDILKYIPVDQSKYIPAYHVCRSFATDFVGYMVSVFHCDGVGKVLDFKGHHSYNVVVTHTGNRTLHVHVVEPQANMIIPAPNPARHYSGSGICILGG